MSEARRSSDPDHRHTVLVVDDYEPLRYALATMIAVQGCAVETARTGAEALDLLATGYRPCLILLDVALPGADGWNVRAQLTADPRWHGLSVVMISAAPEFLRGAPHAVPVLLKPVDADGFLDVLAAHAACAPS